MSKQLAIHMAFSAYYRAMNLLVDSMSDQSEIEARVKQLTDPLMEMFTDTIKFANRYRPQNHTDNSEFDSMGFFLNDRIFILANDKGIKYMEYTEEELEFGPIFPFLLRSFYAVDETHDEGIHYPHLFGPTGSTITYRRYALDLGSLTIMGYDDYAAYTHHEPCEVLDVPRFNMRFLMLAKGISSSSVPASLLELCSPTKHKGNNKFVITMADSPLRHQRNPFQTVGNLSLFILSRAEYLRLNYNPDTYSTID